jgi:release factor glutamine methyltransferase
METRPTKACTTVKQWINTFWPQHEKQLLASYPGLTQHRLSLEIEGPNLFFPHRSHTLVAFAQGLLEGIPFAYLSGKTYFFENQLAVGPEVLIPRPETELLVELVLAEIQHRAQAGRNSLRVADIGTGSGAIIITILQKTSLPLIAWASEISAGALKIARKNYFQLYYTIDKTYSLNFQCTDRLLGLPEDLDIIVSNPPYLKKKADAKQVHPQVARFEPSVALYLDDGQYFPWYQEFFKQSFEHLAPDGMLFLEGHEDHLQELEILAKKTGFEQTLIMNDLAQKRRFLRALRK